ncbi:hypothetical protein PVAND_001461 [Polypedilum vanderplanki]|uniref:Prefoldin subunit n=1 Tax=Polypedilum vanderplanki TaxID=319348 RepID=A0A9J6BNI1_POLVA|nr:hypothetical protein PVAND_001461 [Polypedilum vanderplanki]
MSTKINKSPEEIERFINDTLKLELANLEKALMKINEDMLEYMQLEQSLEFIKKHKPDGFKTQVDLDTNTFMEAQVDKIEPIIVNIGLNVFLELGLEEALKFLELRIKILNKQADVVREQSLKIKTEIKILLMYLGDIKGFNTNV